MTVLIFPSNPQNGDTYTAPNGTLYTYDGVKWIVTTTTITGEQSVNFVQDSVAPLFTGMTGNGVTVSYNSTNNTMDMSVDSLVVGDHNFSLNIDGTLSLDGEPFTGSGANTGDIAFNNGIIYNNNENGPIFIDPSNDQGNTAYIAVPGPVDAPSVPLSIGNQMAGGVQILSGQKSWMFDNTGRLTLPEGADITDSNGSSVLGSLALGDVTFDTNVVQGSGYELGLSPGPDFTSGAYTSGGPDYGAQYFRIRGGDDYRHLHFDTTNNQVFDLYVGDDAQYVAVMHDGSINIRGRSRDSSDQSGTVFIQAGDGKHLFSGQPVTGVDLSGNYVIIQMGGPHGLVNQDVVQLTNLGGSTELNNNTYTVWIESPSSFSLYTRDGVHVESGTVSAWTSGGLVQAGTDGADLVLSAGGYNGVGTSGDTFIYGNNFKIGDNLLENYWNFNQDGTIDLQASGVIRNGNGDQRQVQLVSQGYGGYTQLQWVPDQETFRKADPNSINQYTHWLWVDSEGTHIENSEINSEWLFKPNSTLEAPPYAEVKASYEFNITANSFRNNDYYVKEFLPANYGNGAYGSAMIVRAIDYAPDGTLIALGANTNSENAFLMRINQEGGTWWQVEFTNANADALAVENEYIFYTGLRRGNTQSIVKWDDGDWDWQLNIQLTNLGFIQDMEVKNHLWILVNDNNYDGSNKDSWTLIQANKQNGSVNWQFSLQSLTQGGALTNQKSMGMAVDGFYRTMVVGNCDDLETTEVSVTVIDNDGTLVWSKILNNEFNSNLELRSADAAVDSNGNWYVYCIYGGGGLATSVTKLNPVGDIQWSKGWTGTCIDMAANITVDETNNLVIFGSYTQANNFFSEQTYVRRINSDTGETTHQGFFGKPNQFNWSGSVPGWANSYSAHAGRLLAVHNGKIAISGLTQTNVADAPYQGILNWIAQIPADYQLARNLGDYEYHQTNFEFLDAHPTWSTAYPSVGEERYALNNNWTFDTQQSSLQTQDYRETDSTWSFNADGSIDLPNGSLGPIFNQDSIVALSTDNPDGSAMLAYQNESSASIVNANSNGVGIGVNTPGYGYNWSFDIDGKTEFPSFVIPFGNGKKNSTLANDGDGVANWKRVNLIEDDRAWYSILGDGENSSPSILDNTNGNVAFDVLEAGPDGSVFAAGVWDWDGSGIIYHYNRHGEVIWHWISNSSYNGVSALRWDEGSNQLIATINSSISGRNNQGVHIIHFQRRWFENQPSNVPYHGRFDIVSVHWLADGPDLNTMTGMGLDYVNGQHISVGRMNGQSELAGDNIPAVAGTSDQVLVIARSSLTYSGTVLPSNNGQWSIVSVNDGGATVNTFLGSEVGKFSIGPGDYTATNPSAEADFIIEINYNNHQYYVNWTGTSNGWTNGDSVTIKGSKLGGVDDTNDCVFNIAVFNENGQIGYPYNTTGTAATTTIRFDFTGSGVHNLTDPALRVRLSVITSSDPYIVNNYNNFAKTLKNPNSGEFSCVRHISNTNNTIAGGYAWRQNGPEGILANFAASGGLNWVKGGFDHVYSIDVDNAESNGRIFVAVGGIYMAIDENTGTKIWETSANGVHGGNDSDSSFVKYYNGYLYACQIYYSNYVGRDVLLVEKLSPSTGQAEWARLVVAREADFYQNYYWPGSPITVTEDGVYVTGYGYFATDNDYNAGVIKIPLDGGVYYDYNDGVPGNIDNQFAVYATTNGSQVASWRDVTDNITLEERTDFELDTPNFDDGMDNHSSGFVYLPVNTINMTASAGANFSDGTPPADHNPVDIPQNNVGWGQNSYYTLKLNDRGRFIRTTWDSNSNVYVVVPSDSEVPFPIGSIITLINMWNNGNWMYVRSNNEDNFGFKPKVWCAGQNNPSQEWGFQGISTATLMKVGPNEWLLTGNNIQDTW